MQTFESRLGAEMAANRNFNAKKLLEEIESLAKAVQIQLPEVKSESEEEESTFVQVGDFGIYGSAVEVKSILGKRYYAGYVLTQIVLILGGYDNPPDSDVIELTRATSETVIAQELILAWVKDRMNAEIESRVEDPEVE